MIRTLARSLFLAVTLAACGSGGSPVIHPSLVFIQAPQTDTVGRTLAAQLQVRLTDTSSGAPLVGYVVNWSAPDGGSLFVPVTQTGTNGTTSNVFTLGPRVGTQSVVVRYIDPQTGTPLTVATAYITALPAVAAAIVLSPGVNGWPPAIRVGDTATYSVSYQDNFGNFGAPCPAGGIWEDLTWTLDTALVRLVDIKRTTGGADTRFAAIHTGGAQFMVTTACALAGIRTVSTTYSLAINP